MSAPAKTTDLAVRNSGTKPSPSVSAAKSKTPKKTKNPAPPAQKTPTTAKRDRRKKSEKSEKALAQEKHQGITTNNAATPKKKDKTVQEMITPATTKKDVESKKCKQKAGEAFKGNQEKQSGKKPKKGAAWRLSPHLGGRYLPIDPVFSKDEKHILLANLNSLKVFSTKTSLLVRPMVIPSPKHAGKPEVIVSYFLNPQDKNQVFIATSLSRLFLWDWTTGQQLFNWNLGLPSLYGAIGTDEDLASDSEAKGVVYVASVQSKQPGGVIWRIRLPNQAKNVEKVQLLETRERVKAMEIHDNGRLLCAIAGKELITIKTNAQEWNKPQKHTLPVQLTCLNVYVTTRTGKEKKDKKGEEKIQADVVVGDKMGFLHVLRDVTNSREPTSQKLHWHRQAVHTVTWHLNGAYIISGGMETVLVQWQLDTGIRQFLPNLGSAINKIVVSPKGASYAISLADNSVMVLSISEFKPTTNIAGIQTVVQDPDRKPHRVPCVLRPDKASNLLLATPSEQTGRNSSSPYLQTFDTFSDRHISRQALARTNATQLNQGPDFTKIIEPNITHLAISASGEWLASVDEWRPRPYKSRAPEIDDELRGREVFLRFWRWSEKNGDWELITRVDTPHPIPGQLSPGQVLALEAAPQCDAFITVGSDGCARVWKPRARTRAGVPVQRSGEGEMLNWSCRREISFSKGKTEGELSALALLDDLEHPLNTREKRWWSSAALSEDGSVLAVAAPASELQTTANDSLVHLIDTDTGNISQTLAGLRIGPVTGIAMVERSLVVLGTSKLLVWDLVDGEVDWEYELQEFGATTSTGSTHLTVDLHSRTFAVSFTGANFTHKIAIFNHENPEPIHIETLGAPVAALLATGGSKGYMFLDTQARVQYLSPIQTPHFSLALASRGQIEAEEQSKLSEAYSSVVKEDITQINAIKTAEEDEDGVVDKVVPREALESVFGDVPAYGQRPLEEAFEGVLGLFAKKPLDDIDDEEEEEEDSDEDIDD